MACECGVKPHGKEECLEEKSESDSTSDPGEQHACCCSHGMRCTCALKREHLNPVPEMDLPLIPPIRRKSSKKPRLAKAGSESSMTQFTNGHHRPTHKHNDSAHTLGVPYKIPIPHSVAGNADVARRSTDSLPLLKRKESLHKEISISQKGSRLSKSEHGSPLPRGKDSLPPLDFNFPFCESFSSYDDYFQPPIYTSHDVPALSAGLSMSPVADWPPPMDLSAIYQNPSFNSYERPAIATSSSGEVSEVSDYVSHTPSKPEVSTPNLEDQNLNRRSPSYPITQTLPPELTNYVPATIASPTEVEEASLGRSLGSEVFEKHGLSVHDAQKLAHPDTPTEAMSDLKLPPAPEEKAIWAGLSSPSETSFVSQQEVEGTSWQR